jgi:hypothetical protein
MKAVFLLSVYFVSFVGLLGLGIYQIKKIQGNWGHLTSIIALSFVPLLNSVLFFWLIIAMIEDTGVFNQHTYMHEKLRKDYERWDRIRSEIPNRVRNFMRYVNLRKYYERWASRR